MSGTVIHLIADRSNGQELPQALAIELSAEILTETRLDELSSARQPLAAECVLLDLEGPALEGALASGRVTEAIQSGPPFVIIAEPQGGMVRQLMELARLGTQFVTKPTDRDLLRQAIQRAWCEDARQKSILREQAVIKSRIRLLTARERQVLNLIVLGMANKLIAAELRLSQKTVEAHRSKVMHKMAAASLAQLIHMLYAAGLTGTQALATVVKEQRRPMVEAPAVWTTPPSVANENAAELATLG